MSDIDAFLDRDDVQAVIKPLAEKFFNEVTENPTAVAPDPAEHLRNAGIEPPDGSNLRFLGPDEELRGGVSAPICQETGHSARPTHCHPWPTCVWICTS